MVLESFCGMQRGLVRYNDQSNSHSEIVKEGLEEVNPGAIAKVSGQLFRGANLSVLIDLASN